VITLHVVPLRFNTGDQPIQAYKIVRNFDPHINLQCVLHQKLRIGGGSSFASNSDPTQGMNSVLIRLFPGPQSAMFSVV
jgi:hypothetical protein